MSLDSRVGKIEEAMSIMKDLLVSHDERLENYFNALNRERQERLDGLNQERQEREESRRDFDFKLNALIDSQIKTEAEIIEIKESIIELRQISGSALERIERLESSNNRRN
jgi:septal ring factor EnvC (AmiA/AmiB activator)